MTSAPTTTSGSIEDVAAFFRVSLRTIHTWKGQRLIAHYQEGRNVWFHESDVVRFELSRRVQSEGEKPGQAEESIRKEWREHLKCRDKIEELERRLFAIERFLAEHNPIAA